MPYLYPSSIHEMIEMGLLGIAMATGLAMVLLHNLLDGVAAGRDARRVTKQLARINNQRQEIGPRCKGTAGNASLLDR